MESIETKPLAWGQGTTTGGKEKSPRTTLVGWERLPGPPIPPLGAVGELQCRAVSTCKAVWEGPDSKLQL